MPIMNSVYRHREAGQVLTDMDAYVAAGGFEAIVHAAADVGVAGGSGPAGDINVAGTRAVLEAAADNGVRRVVYTSSLAVFLPTPDEVITDASALAEPLSAYGRSKRDAELLVRAAQDDGRDIVTLYPGGVYGPISTTLDNGFAAIIGAMNFAMLCPPGGMGVIDVRDVADLIVAALERPQGANRYLCGGHFVTWMQWTEALRQAAGTEVSAVEVTAEAMIEMGRDFDRQREAGAPSSPLSEEAAIIMCAGRPTDDSRTLAELNMSYRPVVETFADVVEYLRGLGELPTIDR